jgi:uncharacterized Tic20 family protein
VNDAKDRIFSTVDLLLSYIDSGVFFRKPFWWLYVLLAAANALAPFYVLFATIRSGIFTLAEGTVLFSLFVALLLVWLACWLGALIWWNRKDKVLETSSEGSEFSATPVLSHFIQTLGENYGVFVAIVGAGTSLLVTVFLGGLTEILFENILPFNPGFFGIFIFPVIGYLSIVVSRFIAEQMRALAAIANNTKK